MEEHNLHSNPPDEQELRAYIEGRLSPQRQREIELLAQSDPLLADAIDGFRDHPGAMAGLDELRNHFSGSDKNEPRISTKNAFFMAAGFLLLLAVSYFLFVPDNLLKNSSIAEEVHSGSGTKERNQPSADKIHSDTGTLDGESNPLSDSDFTISDPDYAINANQTTGVFNGSVTQDFVDVSQPDVSYTAPETVAPAENSLHVSNPDGFTHDLNSPVDEQEEPIEVIVDEQEIMEEDAIEPEPVTVDSEVASQVVEKKISARPALRVSPSQEQILQSEENVHVPLTGHRNSIPVSYLNQLKVIDYRLEYQSKEKKSGDNQQGLSPQYANKEELNNEKVTPDIQPVSYWDVLNQATEAVQHKKYDQALQLFGQILKEHPDDENGLFYSAFSYFQNYETTQAIELFDSKNLRKSEVFGPESQWYLALCYERTGDFKAARKLYRKIVKSGGFYAEKASKRLTELED